MTTDVRICSNALLLLGGQRFTAFTDNTDHAEMLQDLWPQLRQACLRSHPWNCAIKRQILSADLVAPVGGDWTYQYALPSDWLRTLQVGRDSDKLEWRMEGRKILCDETGLPLKYIFDNADCTTWDALLVDAATAFVAASVAYTVTKSAAQQEAMFTLWKAKLALARTIDGMEDTAEDQVDFPLIAIRGIP